MINAEAARSISMKAQQAISLEKYDKLVQDAARDGHREVRVEYFIPEEQVKALKKLGFDVVRREDEENALSVIRW